VRLLPASLLLLVLVTAAPAAARTWRVAKDGSGDFAVIQAAVDAAAPGDTVSIGPGRFREKAPYTTPGWTEDVYVVVTKDNLTFIGSGQDVTIIGPATRLHTLPAHPKGFAILFVSSARIEGVSIENVADGIYQYQGRLEVRTCALSRCEIGLSAWTDAGLIMNSCQADSNSSHGVVTFGPASNIRIAHSEFVCNYIAISLANGTTDALVEDCNIMNGGGVSITSGSDAVIRQSRFFDMIASAVYVSLGSSAVVSGNSVRRCGGGLVLNGGCHVSGTNNILDGSRAGQATLNICNSTLDFRGNHILKGEGPSVLLSCYSTPQEPVTVDLSGNYWGTASRDSIAAWIWDGNDDPAIRAFVDFEPFATEPLPAERKSLGSVKSLYKR
jgi:hypothetical protein